MSSAHHAIGQALALALARHGQFERAREVYKRISREDRRVDRVLRMLQDEATSLISEHLRKIREQREKSGD